MDTDIFLIETARPGATGDINTGAVEWTTIRVDVDGPLARPNIQSIDHVPGVTITNPVDGQAIVYDGGGFWKNAVIPVPAPVWGAIGGVIGNQADLATALAGKAALAHTHSTPSNHRTSTAASGNLSSGPQPAGSLSVALAAGVEYLVEAELLQTVRGSGGSSYYLLEITIDGTTYVSVQKQTVGGVPDTPSFIREKTIVGTGAAKTVSAVIRYDAGDPVDVRAAELIVRLRPNR